MPALHIEKYGIPEFALPKNDNQEKAPDPNQGNLFSKTDTRDPEDGSSEGDKNKDNPEAGHLF